MKINWLVRVRNKNFWIAIIPAVLLLVQAIAELFGLNVDFNILSQKLICVVNAAFVVLAIMGVVNDPTTAGIGDSERALTYERPSK